MDWRQKPGSSRPSSRTSNRDLREEMFNSLAENDILRQKLRDFETQLDCYKSVKNDEMQTMATDLDNERQLNRWLESRLKFVERENRRLGNDSQNLTENHKQMADNCRRLRQQVQHLTQSCTDAEQRLRDQKNAFEKEKSDINSSLSRKLIETKTRLDSYESKKSKDYQSLSQELANERQMKTKLESELEGVERVKQRLAEEFANDVQNWAKTETENQELSERVKTLVADRDRMLKDIQQFREKRNRIEGLNLFYKSENQKLNQKYKEFESRVKNLNEEVVRKGAENRDLIRKLSESEKQLICLNAIKMNEIKTLSDELTSERNYRKQMESTLKTIKKEKQRCLDRFKKTQTRDRVRDRTMGRRLQTLNADKQMLTKHNQRLRLENSILNSKVLNLNEELVRIEEEMRLKLNNQFVQQFNEMQSIPKEVNDGKDGKLSSEPRLEVIVSKESIISEQLVENMPKVAESLTQTEALNCKIEALSADNEKLAKKSKQLLEICHKLELQFEQMADQCFKADQSVAEEKRLNQELFQRYEREKSELKSTFEQLVDTNRTRVNIASNAPKVVRNNRLFNRKTSHNLKHINNRFKTGFVQCPKCPLKLYGLSTLRKHLKVRHFIPDNVDKNDNNVIETSVQFDN